MRTRLSKFLAVLLLSAFAGTGMPAPRRPSVCLEDFIRQVMVHRYAHPSVQHADQRTKFNDTTVAELAEETERVKTEFAGVLTVAKEHGWEFRDSKVFPEIVSTQVKNDIVNVEVRVRAEWYWGYLNLPTETPTEIYNMHQLQLAATGDSWRIIMDRNLASRVKATEKVPAPNSAVTTDFEGRYLSCFCTGHPLDALNRATIGEPPNVGRPSARGRS